MFAIFNTSETYPVSMDLLIRVLIGYVILLLIFLRISLLNPSCQRNAYAFLLFRLHKIPLNSVTVVGVKIYFLILYP